ncbi:MAG: [FeFe] hydrogenase H-cluster maturation GTPase HydF [Schwartzia sp. (in: firmicutes)]
MGVQDTPRGERLHIGLFGRRNAGKSSLVNALTGQEIAIVSPVAGTTTDPVYKAMELSGIGPVVFIDTAGFDDEGDVGAARVEKTRQAAERADMALLFFSGEEMAEELRWADWFKARRVPVIPLVSRCDTRADGGAGIAAQVKAACGLAPLCVSLTKGRAAGAAAVRDAILRALPSDHGAVRLTGGLARPGDTVLLVMPQDIAAPKGRLILPQVQTIRALLDASCVVLSVTADALPSALSALKAPPDLIITDSQVFSDVFRQKPASSRLTSFSVLFANYKGDIDYYVASAQRIDALPKNARILIAEACTHAPVEEDIGRVKIPRALKKRLGAGITVEVVSGVDFPDDLAPYDLIVHCGGCMFNRRYVLSRIDAARAQGTPMTNYGVLLAKLAGILEQISLPGQI